MCRQVTQVNELKGSITRVTLSKIIHIKLFINSQNALHVESAKQLFITIFIPVVEHTPTLRHSMFLFLFSLFIYHSFHMWPNWFSKICILQFAVNEVTSILVTFVTIIFFFFKKKKKIPGYKESLFVLNHLIHIFSIYMYYIYIW